MLRIVALNLNAMVERDSRLIARLIGDHIVLELDLDRSIRPVRGDAVQLRQVSLNLGVNGRMR